MSFNNYKQAQTDNRNNLCIFSKIMIFVALSKRVSNKLSNDTKLLENWIILENKITNGVYFLLLSLYFTCYFTEYLKVSMGWQREPLVVICHMCLLLFCVTFTQHQHVYNIMGRNRAHLSWLKGPIYALNLENKLQYFYYSVYIIITGIPHRVTPLSSL